MKAKLISKKLKKFSFFYDENIALTFVTERKKLKS